MVSNKKVPIPTHAGVALEHVPMLISPISAAHMVRIAFSQLRAALELGTYGRWDLVGAQDKMLEGEGGVKSSGNWMRDQWVANLKKKQLAGGAGVGGGMSMTKQVLPVQQTNNSSGSRATKAGGRNTSRRNNQRQQQQQQQRLQLQQQQQQLEFQQQQLELQQQNLLLSPLMGNVFGEKDAMVRWTPPVVELARPVLTVAICSSA